MSNFKFVKLNSVCKRITDGSHYSPVGIEKGIPMLSVKDMKHDGFSYDDCKYINEEEYEKMLRNDCVPLINDILIAKDGSYLKHVFVVKENKKQAILSSIGILRPDLKKIDPSYLKYYLHSSSVKETVAKKYVSGSALPRIILKNFGEIDIIYKDLPTQQKIASVLSVLDDKIDLNNKINAELEAMAKTLYDYWFVQFDFPDTNGMPYKSSSGKMVYNETLKREIPVGWEVKKIRNIAKTGSGGTPKSTEKAFYENGTIPWINSGELNNAFIVSTENFISELGMNNSSAKLFPAKTILMAMYGATAGKTSIISFEATTNQAICAIMPLNDLFFYYTKFVLDDMYQYLINLSTGSARDNLSQEKIKELNIIIPYNKTIKAFSTTVNQFYNKIENNLIQNQELAQLRDWLLPMLMNGQVTVSEAEEKVGMVAEGSVSYMKC